MNTRILLIVLLPFFLMGCDDIFDAGDSDKAFDDDPQVEFKPLSQEVSDAAGTATVTVQLIAPHQDSDINVSFSTGGSAVAGEHYDLVTTSPVTISSGTSSVDVEVQLHEGSVDGEVTLNLTIDDASGGVIPAENLKEATIFIQGS